MVSEEIIEGHKDLGFSHAVKRSEPQLLKLVAKMYLEKDIVRKGAVGCITLP
jgi:hypothetical protein